MLNTHAFGIDLGGTTVKMGLFTTHGTLVERWAMMREFTAAYRWCCKDKKTAQNYIS